MPKTVCILYGFTEGQWHGKKMRAAITARGWQVTTDPHKADIIVAHSGGVFFIPKPHKNQQLLLVDPTCPAHKNGTRHVLEFTAWEVRHTLLSRYAPLLLWRWLHNLWYIITNFGYSREIVRRFHTVDISGFIQHPGTVIAQSANRNWYDAATLQKLAGKQKPAVHFIGAHHDDCWERPDTYLDLVA